MTIDSMSGAELDTLAAETVMGWYRGYGGRWSWGEHSAGAFLDGSGPSIASWRPSRGKALNRAANEVLLKALGDDKLAQFWLRSGPDMYCVTVISANSGDSWESAAPTLPLALIPAACKAYEVEHE